MAKVAKKKVKKNVQSGICHIQSTFNNTIVSITDVSGNVVAWSSAGTCGFKGSRKSTPFAAQLAAEDAAKKAMEHGVRNVTVYVNGPGAGRESALRNREELQELAFPVARFGHRPAFQKIQRELGEGFAHVRGRVDHRAGGHGPVYTRIVVQK